MFDDKGDLEIAESRNSCYGHGLEDSNSLDCNDFSFSGFSVAPELCPILALGEAGQRGHRKCPHISLRFL